MKTKTTLLYSILAGMLLASAAANAQAIAFDFESGSNTQTGFTSFSSGTSATTAAPASVQLTLSRSVGGFRLRADTDNYIGDPDFDILRDLFFIGGTDTTPLNFTFSNLAPSTEYSVVMWAVDTPGGNNNNRTATFTTNGGSVNHTTDQTFTNPAEFSVPSLTTNASGVGVVTMSGSGNNYPINGIQLTVVPEPSSFALLAGFFGLSWVMLRRRCA